MKTEPELSKETVIAIENARKKDKSREFRYGRRGEKEA